MKLSQMIAKLTGGKAKVFGVVGGLVLAGAAVTVAAPKAEAQVAFGVEVGAARYYAPAQPVYVGQGYGYGYDQNEQHEYWEHRRAEEGREQQYREQQWREQQWREQQIRQQQWREQQMREHEEWEHRGDFDRDRRFGGRDGWR